MPRLTFSIPWPMEADETRSWLEFTFETLTATYLIFRLIDWRWPGYVSFYLSINPLLWAAMALGVLSLMWPAIVQMSSRPVRTWWQRVILDTIVAVYAALLMIPDLPSATIMNRVVIILLTLSAGVIFDVAFIQRGERQASTE